MSIIANSASIKLRKYIVKFNVLMVFNHDIIAVCVQGCVSSTVGKRPPHYNVTAGRTTSITLQHAALNTAVTMLSSSYFIPVL